VGTLSFIVGLIGIVLFFITVILINIMWGNRNEDQNTIEFSYNLINLFAIMIFTFGIIAIGMGGHHFINATFSSGSKRYSMIGIIIGLIDIIISILMVVSKTGYSG